MNEHYKQIMGSYENQNFYLDPSDSSAKDLKSMMDYYYEFAYPSNAAFWREAYIDKRFKVGDPTINPSTYGISGDKNSAKFVFNLIARQINMIVGRQRQNRKSTITVPRFDNDSLCDDFNKLLRWSETTDGFQEYLSQSFEGACDTGISLLHLYPDYQNDPVSGDLYTENVAYNNFLIDPFFRKQDLSDCQFLWRRKWVSKESAKSLLPSMEKEIEKMKPSGGIKDGRFPLQAELLNAQTSNLFTYDEFYYRSQREAVVLHDPITRESSEWYGDDQTELEAILASQPWLVRQKKQVGTVKLCIALGDKIVYNGANLLGIDQYPFAPVLAYHEPDIQSYSWRLRGVVRNLRDSQFLFNRRKCIEMSILESQVNSGWIFQNNALTDLKALRQTGQGLLIPVKGDKPIAEAIQPVPKPSIDPSLIELSRSLEELPMKISGVNEELLGSAQDDKSGILSMLRQGSGLTTLQTLFDKLDYSQRIFGKIRLEAIIKNFDNSKIKNILGEEPNPSLTSPIALQYSMQLEEGNYSATQRQTELQQLLHFKQIGIEGLDETILKKAVISDKESVLQSVQQQQQQQQEMQQQQAQAAQETADKETNAKVMQSYAKAKLDAAKEEETRAKAEELLSQKAHNETRSDLELVKMLIELEDMDFDQYRRSLEMADAIRGYNNNAQPEEEKSGIQQ